MRSLVPTSLPLAGLLAALLVSGCDPAPQGAPPLRPLLYTEAHGGATDAPPGYESWTPDAGDPVAWPTRFGTRAENVRRSATPHEAARSAEALLEGVTRALLEGDEEALSLYLFSADELQASARMRPAGAASEAQNIRDATVGLLRRLHADRASERIEGGLATQLRIGQTQLGRGRRIDGGASEDPDEIVLHWSNEVRLHHTRHALSFGLHFRRILRGSDGIWRLQEAPRPDLGMNQFHASGLHLRSDLMAADAFPLPVAEGAFWHYRARLPEEDLDARLQQQRGYRDEVTRVEDYGLYRIVHMQRRHDPPSSRLEPYLWLQTPRGLWHCNWECRRHRENLEWLLTYMRYQTPWLALPLHPMARWGAGGDPEGSTWRVRVPEEAIDVPAGRFLRAYEIARTSASGRDSRWLAPGIGIILRESTEPGEASVYELMHYRILP